ncbi:MAG: hypothetical protein AB1468_06410 [Candidatus Micrarchaeota archaeon]
MTKRRKLTVTHLTATHLRILKILAERPATIKDLQETYKISKPTFAAFARLAKELNLVQTGEICGYYYMITPKGRKILSLSAEIEEALEDLEKGGKEK